jgi:hypothetical protein
MGERVAKLEANHESLKDDTGHIRSAIHEVNGELQKLVLLEHACQISLVNLTQDAERSSPLLRRSTVPFRPLRACAVICEPSSRSVTAARVRPRR